ncbi:hypothetical protein BD414DRAFT_213853 [Trametes punicea]|nr:hypothetical protein BD414DRAFT_213853 [Trametes punicea]
MPEQASCGASFGPHVLVSTILRCLAGLTSGAPTCRTRPPAGNASGRFPSPTMNNTPTLLKCTINRMMPDPSATVTNIMNSYPSVKITNVWSSQAVEDLSHGAAAQVHDGGGGSSSMSSELGAEFRSTPPFLPLPRSGPGADRRLSGQSSA